MRARAVALLALVLAACGQSAAQEQPAAPAQPGPVALVAIDVEASSSGNERVTLRFDHPLPDPDAVEHTRQHFPELQVCGSTHWFPADDGGSIDLFLPTAGMDLASLERPPVMEGAQEKIVFCEPRQGEVQISFWGMGPSVDAPGTAVTVAEDGRSIVVENR
jgi:hypothetical protein